MRVVDFGFRVQGLGFRVQDSGFEAQSIGFKVQGSGFRFLGSPITLLGVLVGWRVKLPSFFDFCCWKKRAVKSEPIFATSLLKESARDTPRPFLGP